MLETAIIDANLSFLVSLAYINGNTPTIGNNIYTNLLFTNPFSVKLNTDVSYEQAFR